jgi:hypothetical protein
MSVQVTDYTRYPALAELPALVRKQRRLEAKIAPITPLIEEEKAVRKDIDARLVTAGFASNEGVACLGYDVVHHERKGQRAINEDTLIEQLVALGVERKKAQKAIADSTETGDPSTWATVKPSKGAKVRT